MRLDTVWERVTLLMCIKAGISTDGMIRFEEKHVFKTKEDLLKTL